MREIGSDFWIEQIPENLVEERNGIFAISGRTAIDLILQDILRKRKVKTVAMPAWCCDSMIAAFLAHGIEVKFYECFMIQDSGFRSRIRELENSTSSGSEIFYLTNYFGYENTLPIVIVRQIKDNGTIIIYDRTHSFLMEDDAYQEIADYSFASIRKWMGVVGGAVVNGLSEEPTLKECPYASIKEKAMWDKFQYLQGDANIVKDEFLKTFGEFGHRLAEDYQNYVMDDLSYTLYTQEDLQAMKQKRKENAAYIHEKLKGVQFMYCLTEKSVPLFVPVLIENKELRDDIRKKLIEQQIYCPVHWPERQSPK